VCFEADRFMSFVAGASCVIGGVTCLGFFGKGVSCGGQHFLSVDVCRQSMIRR
jgi:hypothetical protein